jgi:23S rRNA U2552 (ribose-2'-O)-methylase RlmE/FtsJ
MDLPVVDLAPYLEIAALPDPTAEEAALIRSLCAVVSASLRDTGALVVKDPRCTAQDNDLFLDMMERYFERSDEFKRLQERPQLHYQVIICFSFPILYNISIFFYQLLGNLRDA